MRSKTSGEERVGSRENPLILRTVYIFKEQDDRLERHASRSHRSKNNLIAQAVHGALNAWEKEKEKKNKKRPMKRSKKKLIRKRILIKHK